jgi:hypothetical protein
MQHNFIVSAPAQIQLDQSRAIFSEDFTVPFKFKKKLLTIRLFLFFSKKISFLRSFVPTFVYVCGHRRFDVMYIDIGWIVFLAPLSGIQDKTIEIYIED